MGLVSRVDMINSSQEFARSGEPSCPPFFPSRIHTPPLGDYNVPEYNPSQNPVKQKLHINLGKGREMVSPCWFMEEMEKRR